MPALPGLKRITPVARKGVREQEAFTPTVAPTPSVAQIPAAPASGRGLRTEGATLAPTVIDPPAEPGADVAIGSVVRRARLGKLCRQTSDVCSRGWAGVDEQGMSRPAPKRPAPKIRATLYLPADLLDEARNAAVHLAGNPARLTLTKLAENALRAELARLKTLYNQGREFPPRDEDLRGGRPIAA